MTPAGPLAQIWKRSQHLPASPPPGGFVDIHSHPIPGVDDGPREWEVSLAMLRRAAEAGTRVMVATPHGDSRGKWSSVEALREGCARLVDEARRQGLPLQLLLGMEAPLDLDLGARLESGAALSLNGTSAVLVEFPHTQLPLYWEEALFQLQLKGKRPIIAHPERQLQVQGSPDILRGPVDRGVLVQVTAASLAGRMGPTPRKVAEKLLKGNLAHILASDAHAPEGPRGPGMLEGYAVAVHLVGEERAREMTSTLPLSLLGQGAPGPRR